MISCKKCTGFVVTWPFAWCLYTCADWLKKKFCVVVFVVISNNRKGIKGYASVWFCCFWLNQKTLQLF